MGKERDFENYMYTALELETEQRSYGVVENVEVSVAYGYENEDQRQYIDRIYRQIGTKKATSTNEIKGSAVVAEIAIDEDGRYQEVLKQGQYNFEDKDLHTVRTERGKVFIPDLPYMAVSNDTCSPKSTWQVTSMPEIGLSSTIHKSIAEQQFRRHPDLVPFHANAIVDVENNTSIIFSYPAIPGGTKKGGKTTTTLASVVQPGSPFAFYANENLYLEPTEFGVEAACIPAEITASEKTLEAIKADGTQLITEKYSWEFSDELHEMTSAGAIEDAGFMIASELPIPAVWSFIQLEPGSDTYESRRLTIAEARDRFIETVKLNRSALFHTPTLQGERFTAEDMKLNEQLERQAVINATRIFNRLVVNGTQFVELHGGVDREKIYELVRTISGR